MRAILDGVVAILDAGIAECEQWLAGCGGPADVARALVTLRHLRGRATEMR